MSRYDIEDAIKNNDQHKLKMLFDKNPSLINGYDSYGSSTGMTLLYYATVVGTDEIVEFLLANNADVNKGHVSGAIPLHAAALNGKVKLTKLFVEKGANVNKIAERGISPLHSAADKGDAAIISFLILKGAKVNHQKDDGWTPLHTAIFKDHIDAVKALLAGGARIDLKTFDGETDATALQLAKEFKKTEIINILKSTPKRKKKAKFEISNSLTKGKADRLIKGAVTEAEEKIVRNPSILKKVKRWWQFWK